MQEVLSKDTSESKMMIEYYNMVMEFCIVKESSSYWSALIKEVCEFADKYKKESNGYSISLGYEFYKRCEQIKNSMIEEKKNNDNGSNI